MLKLFGMTVDVTHSAIDVAAPGSAIISALARNVNITAGPTPAGSPPSSRWLAVNQNALAMQGTSMASPVVTGLIACLLADEPNLTQADVLRRIRGAGRRPEPARTIYDPTGPDENDWGTGLVNAAALKP